MRAILLVLGFISVFQFGYSQEVNTEKAIELELTIYVANEKEAMAALNRLWDKHVIIPNQMEKNSRFYDVNFVAPKSAYKDLMKGLEDLGEISAKRLTSTDYNQKISETVTEIQQLEEDRQTYSRLLGSENIGESARVQYMDKLETIDISLKDAHRLKAQYEELKDKIDVKLSISDNMSMDDDSDDLSFVNMPGIQYSYFTPARTDGNAYPAQMNGYAIKYLMNRRKTYLELSLFQASEKAADLTYDEMYKFAFGQDFYSRHLGRGRRQFLNLYSGFKVGAFILTGEDKKRLTSWFATPSLGLEIYKTRNFLLDTKAGYFLPFKENRNMRGLLLEASMNVVF